MAETDQNKRMLAALGYVGFFIGLPLGLIPLLMRQDEFTLAHGRHATASWFLHFVSVMVVSTLVSIIITVTCGVGVILVPLIFVPVLFGVVTSIHGIVLSMNGVDEEPMGGLGLGKTLFGSITVAIPSTATPAAPPPPPAPAAPAPAPAPAPAAPPPPIMVEPPPPPVVPNPPPPPPVMTEPPPPPVVAAPPPPPPIAPELPPIPDRDPPTDATDHGGPPPFTPRGS